MLVLVLLALTVVPPWPGEGPFLLGDVDDQAVVSYRAAVAHRPLGSLLSVEIDSAGGNVYQLLRLLGVTEEAHRKGVIVQCVVTGIAASAAAIFFVAGCDTRVMAPRAVLVFHEAYFTSIASPSFISVPPPDPHQIESLKKLNSILAQFVVAFSKVTLEQYRDHVKDSDWFVRTPEAISLGFADVELGPTRRTVGTSK